VRVEYSSNNSGGRDWLTPDNWRALREAGWDVRQFGSFKNADDWQPVTWDEKARAHYAYKDFPTLKDAIVEFEKITGADSTAEGCNCCGAPHQFSTDDEYVAGEMILPLLYDNVPSSLREACEAACHPSVDGT